MNVLKAVSKTNTVCFYFGPELVVLSVPISRNHSCWYSREPRLMSRIKLGLVAAKAMCFLINQFIFPLYLNTVAYTVVQDDVSQAFTMPAPLPPHCLHYPNHPSSLPRSRLPVIGLILLVTSD